MEPYRFVRDTDESLIECTACGFPAMVKKFPWREPAMHKKGDDFYLCELCASTAAGNAVEDPRRYAAPEILFALSYIGNAILASVRGARN